MKTHLKIDGMSCQHCQQAVEKSLSQVVGVAQVSVDLQSHTATVQGQFDPAALREAVEDAGFIFVSAD